MYGSRLTSLPLRGWLLIGLLGLMAGCRQDMYSQPRSRPLRDSDFFANGALARPLPPHTIARGQLFTDEWVNTGRIGTNLVAVFPDPVTPEVMRRGRERFEIYCAPCHGRTGDGDGVVVQRGFPAPPSYHIDRLREAPVGHFVDVITRGYGVMFSYAARVTPSDRWAIAAYLRALQLSQHAQLNDAPDAEQTRLQTQPQ
jgi:mono/diheme cytochrome c family protein